MATAAKCPTSTYPPSTPYKNLFSSKWHADGISQNGTDRICSAASSFVGPESKMEQRSCCLCCGLAIVEQSFIELWLISRA